MNTRIKLATLGLISAMMISIATPMTAQAGTLSIYNENCTKTYNFSTKKRVKVHVFNGNTHCTSKKVTVHQGHTETIALREMASNNELEKCGKYAHEAVGTAGGKHDVHGDEDSHVTCKKDWAGVCQCTKDYD